MRSEFYDVPGFLGGNSQLDELELSAFGNVTDKSLLHLQCHFGLSTLDWARRGAIVTGVDFSDVAIAQARELAHQAELTSRAEFICADVLELDKHLQRQFDFVFTSYGVITWLSSLKRWGEVVAHFLKRGGQFFIAEVHPAGMIFEERNGILEQAFDYFHDPRGLQSETQYPDYADASYLPQSKTREWQWTLADIYNALADAGLRITRFEEYPFSCFRQFPFLVETSRGHFEFPEGHLRLPLTFCITAVKP